MSQTETFHGLQDLSASESKAIIGGREIAREDERSDTLVGEVEEARGAKKTVDGLMCWSEEIC